MKHKIKYMTIFKIELSLINLVKKAKNDDWKRYNNK